VTQASSQPNILFLLTDDQAYWTTGYNGHPLACTPEMDRLAADGLVLDRHYDTTPICMASRANIATGLYEYRTGCNFEHGQMTSDIFSRSYHVLLREAGYFTGFIGKFGFGVGDSTWPKVPHYYGDESLLPNDQFDWWRGQTGQASYVTAQNPNMAYLADEFPHLTRANAHVAGEFLSRAEESGKPFCLSISFKAPHGPMTPDPVFNDLHAGDAFPRPENYGEQGAAHLAPHIRTGRQWEQFEQSYGPERFADTYRKYFRLIHGVDVGIGMIRRELKARGLADNTVIVFTSDNGFFCGSHRLTGKSLTYEESTRVPMVIYDPRHPVSGKGLRCRQLSANIDIAPTLLDFAGASAPDGLDGVSLRPLLDRPEESVRESVSLLNCWNVAPTQGLTVTDGRLKYVHYWYQGEGMVPTEELFDLIGDPQEMRNLVDSPDGVADLARMRDLYDSAVAHIRDHAVQTNRYEDYGILFDRNIPWTDKADLYTRFFDRWVRYCHSWRGGPWFEAHDLSPYPEDSLLNYGKFPRNTKARG
jgi:arylsulfatase A-like enzyme